ncbi:MAG: sugar ABC transporter permease [Deltaproteobacteria bacterium]|nr:sugar ABC transporter permease [Deltaproteobacteria bacterium]MBW1793023.1 sugar ABC transporter permease [Deltaproteobacteria bacterium]MBW2329593.1 sugar ABC transporter permease [Deltaproteobacteria bacterium]
MFNQQSTIINRQSFLDQESRLAFWMLVPTFTVVLAFVIFPVIWNVWLSLKPVSLGDLRGTSLFKFNLTLENFQKVFSDPDFVQALLTTLIYTVAGSTLSILLGLIAALLVHGEFPGRGLLRGLFISPYIAPVVAVAFTWSFILDPQLGVLNWLAVDRGLFAQPIPFLSQRWWELDLMGVRVRLPLALTSVILFEGWRYFPFAFLFILARLQAIPDDLYQAASVDGASPFQRFYHITLPQLATVLSTLFLFRFIWTFNKFDDIFLLTRGQAGTKVLTIKVYDYAFGEFNIGASSAVAMVLFAVLSVFLLIYFHWIAKEG